MLKTLKEEFDELGLDLISYKQIRSEFIKWCKSCGLEDRWVHMFFDIKFEDYHEPLFPCRKKHVEEQ